MRDDGPRDLAVDVTPYAQSLVVPTQSQTKDRQDDGLSLDEQPTVQLESAQAALESAVDITQAKTVKVPAIHSKLPISAESTASPAKMQLIDGNSSFVREWPTDAEWRRARQLRWVKLVIASFIEALLISSILLAAVALRMWHLDAPGLSVREMNFLSQVEDTTDVAFNNPFSSRSAVYPFILRRWISAFGASDMAVRGLSVLCGVLTVAVVYLLARRLAGRNVALISAALLAVAPLHIAYSQLVSRYALLMLASSVLVLLTLLLLEQPKSALRWAGWIASAIILVNIGMSGLILIFSLGVICALKLRYSVWNLIGLGVALAAIATTLLLEVALIWGNGLLVVNEGLPIATTSLVANTLIAYGVGSFDQSLPGLLALPFVALVALGVRLLVHARRDMEMGLLVVWLLGTPVVLFLISFVMPIYDLSLVLSSLPAYAILAAAGIVYIARSARRGARRIGWMKGKQRRGRRRAVMWATANFVLVIAAGGLITVNMEQDTRYFATNVGEPWRAVAADVATHQHAGDLILMPDADNITETAFDYYYLGEGHISQALERISLSSQFLHAMATSDNATGEARLVLQLSQLLGAHSRVWVIAQDSGDQSLQNRLFAAMPTRLVLSSQRIFSGENVNVRVSLWSDGESIGKGNPSG
jgi:hypothetical protein